jgi:diguanylate cyclase (GGDEF)-like protein
MFVSIRRYFEEDTSPLDFRRALVVQGKTLMLVAPVVAIEVMLYRSYGVAGFAIAFLPVLIVAYAMRNEAESAQQNVELVRRNRDLAILTESSTQILSAETDHEALRRLMSLLSKLAQMKACAVVTWEANPDVPGTVYRFGECMPTDQEILKWVESAGLSQSAPSRAFVFQSDMRKFPLSGGRAIQVLIGIQTPEVIYGVLIFETEDPSILKAGSLNLLTLLVNQTALSIQDQLLRREMREKTIQLESHAATMTTILDVSNSLIGQFDVDAALTRIAQSIRKALGFEVVVFALYDARRDEFVRRAHAGLDDVWDEVKKKHVSSAEMAAFFNAEFRVSNSFFVSHQALRQSEHDFFVRPEDVDDSFLKPDEWHQNDMLLVPLASRTISGEPSVRDMMGYLSVRDPHDRRVPSIEKVQTLEVFATQAVTALQSARQYEEIKRLTFIDALTPAYNHRFFQEALSKEIHRHSRTSREMALAMLDIDNFKRINDSFGHPVGDEILKGIVEELMRNARDSDVVARYGGEEFAIIFPDTPALSARDAANRMRELVEQRDFELKNIDRTLHITVSIGVAVYPRDGATAAELISRADAALYYAKKHGKNQVKMADEVLSAEAM